ncbi:MAG: histidine phosphatase family protein [Actinomycetota bacterium]
MSDLQCPATLLIARHGDAVQVRVLVEQVRSRRVAAVYSSRMQRAVESADLAASQLGLQPIAVDGLQELAVGELAGAVLKRFTKAIEEITDMHRGETVLVFAHGGTMSLAIPKVSVNAGNDVAAQRFLPHCVPAEVEVDADGWRLVSWPGSVGSEQA